MAREIGRVFDLKPYLGQRRAVPDLDLLLGRLSYLDAVGAPVNVYFQPTQVQASPYVAYRYGGEQYIRKSEEHPKAGREGKNERSDEKRDDHRQAEVSAEKMVKPAY